MKILLIVPLYPPEHIGGTEIFTKNLVKELAKENEITLLTAGKNKSITKGNLTIHYIKPYYFNFFRFPQQVHRFLKKIRSLNEKFDIIVAHMASPAGIIAVRASKLLKIPCVVRLSDLNEELGLKRNYKLHRRLLRIVLKEANHIVAINKNMNEYIKRIKPDFKSSVLPQGIELKPVKKPKTKSTKYLINIARLVEFKDHSTLIRAMYLIHKKYPNYKLIIIGGGPKEKELGKLIKHLNLKDIVTITGMISHRETLNLLKNSDIYLHSSVNEAFGRVYLEAMTYGLPIVSTNIGGPADIIKDGVNGFLVPIKNPEALAKKTMELIKNKTLYREISKNNIRDIKKYSFPNIAKKFIQLYTKVIKECKQY